MAARSKMVVGSDFSSGAKAALARARQLAEVRGAEIVVVHSVPASGAGAPPGLPAAWSRSGGIVTGIPGMAATAARPPRRSRALPPQPDVEAREAAGAAVALAERQLQKEAEASGTVQLRTRMSYGQPHEDILRIARLERAELVVTGTHRPRGAFERFFLGSTADRVLRMGTCPVLVVRRRADWPYQSVLAAVDFSTTSTRALTVLRRLLPEVRPLVLHVLPRSVAGRGANPVRQQALDRLRTLVAGVGYGQDGAELALAVGEARAEILAAAKRAGAGLIAMGTQGRTGLQRLLLGSVAEYVIRAFDGDVLAVPPAAG